MKWQTTEAEKKTLEAKKCKQSENIAAHVQLYESKKIVCCPMFMYLYLVYMGTENVNAVF